jgi:hypothetical protein
VEVEVIFVGVMLEVDNNVVGFVFCEQVETAV